MNIHHLELFYYVARHGGISRALRHIPYGIQQPAVSGQMIQLEEDLGVKLFERTPFSLSPAGQELYAFVEPFFKELGDLESRLRKQSSPLLRLGASELVLRDHLPPIITAMRASHAELRLDLRSGYQPQLVAWLLDRQIDLAITPFEGKPSSKIKYLKLAELPLVLLVPNNSPYQSARDLWALEHISDPLISLPPDETISRLFQKGLKAWQVLWTPSIVASSLDTLSSYVSNGYGIGVSVLTPDLAIKKNKLRVLPLDGFEPLCMLALWQGTPNPLLASLLGLLEPYSKAQGARSRR
jgi:DNA-binding transcriptional LysR family regulator